MSWGYHSDDGRKYGTVDLGWRGDGYGYNYAETFSTGDTIGCGVNFKEHTAYFAKNGRFLGLFSKPLLPQKSKGS
jgi:Ran-binding protein 9/10